MSVIVRAGLSSAALHMSLSRLVVRSVVLLSLALGGLTVSPEAQVVIRQRVELAPPADAPPEPAAAETATSRSATARAGSVGAGSARGAGRDATYIFDPALFGPVRGFRTVYGRQDSPAVPPRLIAATPGQPFTGFLDIYNVSDPSLTAQVPAGAAWSVADSAPIGPFNGSTCGEDDWSYTSFALDPTVVIARFPAYRGFGYRLQTGSAGCPRPNSITSWCPCFLGSEEPVKFAERFAAGGPIEPIVPAALHVEAAPDTLSPGAAAALAVRLVDASGSSTRAATRSTSARPAASTARPR